MHIGAYQYGTPTAVSNSWISPVCAYLRSRDSGYAFAHAIRVMHSRTHGDAHARTRNFSRKGTNSRTRDYSRVYNRASAGGTHAKDRNTFISSLPMADSASPFMPKEPASWCPSVVKQQAELPEPFGVMST